MDVLNTSQITCLIPIKLSTHNPLNDELQRWLEIGLRSYVKFLDPSIVHSFVIISPDAEIDAVKARVAKFVEAHVPSCPFEFKYVKDSWLCPIMINGGHTWGYQQILKLEISRFIYTDLYMILDTDIYMVKPMSLSDIVTTNGRLIMTTDPFKMHPEWFSMSKALITNDAIDPDGRGGFLPDERVIQVTPQIMVTKAVSTLVSFLKIRHGIYYQRTMLEKGFTEYTLYWSWLKRRGEIEKYYDTECGGNTGLKVNNGDMWDIEIDKLRLLGNPIWFYPLESGMDGLRERVRKQFEESQNYFFSLFQSNIGQIPVSEWIAILKPYVT